MAELQPIYSYHRPVMLEECIEGLNISPDGVYADVTFGGGGHSKAILEKLGPKGKLFVFDQDKDAIANVPNDDRIVFFRTNFRYFHNFLRYANCPKVDGIIADFGISSHQIDVPERGFSFRFDAQLDMRMNQEAQFDAKKLINSYSLESLKNIFVEYGEIKNAWKLAQNIVDYRKTKTIETVSDLVEAIGKCAPLHQENKYYATVFQSIRIEVNDEIGAIEQFLLQTPKAIKKDGRLVVLTFHSLEDRPVKNFIKAGNLCGCEQKDVFGNVLAPFKAVNKKVIVASQAELLTNSRSRSAKLRIAQRTEFDS